MCKWLIFNMWNYLGFRANFLYIYILVLNALGYRRRGGLVFFYDFMYFHLLLTEIKNVDPLGQKWTKRMAGSGPSGSRFLTFVLHFWTFAIPKKGEKVKNSQNPK